MATRYQPSGCQQRLTVDVLADLRPERGAGHFANTIAQGHFTVRTRMSAQVGERAR